MEMINAMIKGSESRVEVHGTGKELAVDALVILNYTYNTIYDVCHEAAEEFRTDVGWMIMQHEDAVFSQQSQSKRVTIDLSHEEGGAGNA